jgi:hypothetical protein
LRSRLRANIRAVAPAESVSCIRFHPNGSGKPKRVLSRTQKPGIALFSSDFSDTSPSTSLCCPDCFRLAAAPIWLVAAKPQSATSQSNVRRSAPPFICAPASLCTFYFSRCSLWNLGVLCGELILLFTGTAFRSARSPRPGSCSEALSQTVMGTTEGGYSPSTEQFWNQSQGFRAALRLLSRSFTAFSTLSA